MNKEKSRLPEHGIGKCKDRKNKPLKTFRWLAMASAGDCAGCSPRLLTFFPSLGTAKNKNYDDGFSEPVASRRLRDSTADVVIVKSAIGGSDGLLRLVLVRWNQQTISCIISPITVVTVFHRFPTWAQTKPTYCRQRDTHTRARNLKWMDG